MSYRLPSPRHAPIGELRTTAGTPRPQVDTGKPHPARVHDWLLGGQDNDEVDRQVGEKLPPESRDGARQNRAFTHRAAAWPAGNGVTQFLDIGTGIPTRPNPRQIAPPGSAASSTGTTWSRPDW